MALALTGSPLVGGADDRDLKLIPAGSDWHYWDRTDYPGDGWQGLVFDDRGWSNGPAVLGFGEPDGVTPSTVIADNQQWTAYFRHPFILADAAASTNFTLSLLCDDGAVVWLNGTEIWRYGMPDTGTILPDTPATAERLRTFQLRFWSTNHDLLPLTSGTNVLAVEVHQSPRWRGDLAFDFELAADEVGRPVITVPTSQMLSQSPATLQLTATVRDDGMPLPADPADPDLNDPHRLRWAWSTLTKPAASQGVAWSSNPTNGEAFTYPGSPDPPGTLFTCDPSATLDVPGLYVFEFHATDGEKTASRRITAFVKGGLDPSQWGYSYLSPLPGAEYCPRRTRQLLVRLEDVAPEAIANLSTFVSVVGSSSGEHIGHTRIASDDRTVILTLATGFASDELVTVTLMPILTSGPAGSVEPYQYQFMISQPMPNSEPPPWDGSPSPPPDQPIPIEPMDQSGGGPGPQPFGSLARITANGVSVPSDFPQPVITVNQHPAPGYLFLENEAQSGSRYAMILDNDGSPVWYHRNGGWGLKVQRNDLITWGAFTGADKNFNVVRTYGAVNGYATDNHALEVLEDGGYLLLGTHGQGAVDMTRYLAGASTNAGVLSTVLQEFTATGDLILQFRGWDHFDIRDLEPSVDNPLGGSMSFPHMNAIDVDTDDHLLLSSRNISEVTKIDRDTGRVIWRLGGARSSFTFVDDPLNGFRNQHDISALGDGRYLLFDNGNGHDPQVSRAAEYQLDLTRMTATLVWQFRNTPDYYTSYMGSAQRLPNGNTLINFVGAAYPKVTEVDSEGVKQLEMYLSPGSELYQAYRFPWDGVVAEPYLLLEAYPDHVALIFNKFGDHAVDHYRIYGGVSPAPLTLLATSRTTLARLNNVVNGVSNYFRVTAVSTNGVESPYSNEESLVVNLVRPGENQVLNGDFSAATSSWSWAVSQTAGAEWHITNGISLVDLTNVVTQLSDVRLWQSGLKLLEGREHVLEFDAWALQPRAMEVRLGLNQPPSTTWKTLNPVLTPLPQHFTYPFVMTDATDLDARLTFHFGGSTRDVFLDNVTLWMVASGDFNRDRRVDLEDLAVFTSQWLRQGSELIADFNGDGRVDYRDYVIFAENWSGEYPP